MIDSIRSLRRWNKTNKSAGARMMIGSGGPVRVGLQQQPSFSKVLKRCTKSNKSTTKKEEVAPAPRIPSVISVPFHLVEAASTTTNDDPHDLVPPSYQEAVNGTPECRRSSYAIRAEQSYPSALIQEKTTAHRNSESLRSLSYGFIDDEDEQSGPNQSARNHQREPRAANRPSLDSWSGASPEQSPLIHKDCLLASVRSMASSEAVHEELQRILALPVGGDMPRHKRRPPPPPKGQAKPADLHSKDLFQATPLYPVFPRPPVAGDGPPQNNGWKGARAG